jgi:hypothetical protein
VTGSLVEFFCVSKKFFYLYVKKFMLSIIFFVVVVLTYGSILSCFLMTGGFCRGVYVMKPVLTVGVKNVVVLRRVVGFCFNGVRLVLENPYLCVFSLSGVSHGTAQRIVQVTIQNVFSPGTM